jgi:divalent metal cation (Fe/Co/Zn/Cd) transporter
MTENAPLDIDQELSQSQQVVKCTTQFATCMCVVIAIIKITVYFMTGKDVVRTSALDSCGDLMANCMVLYTGYRMRMEDKKRYPAGQRKFQSIGCLVFSTFMFALMFGNALGNIETLTESPDEVGKEAITGFFVKTRAAWEKDRPWKPWYDEVNDDGEWKSKDDGAAKIDNPIKAFYAASEEESEKKMAEGMDDKVTREEIVDLASEYENEAEVKSELWLANSFLSVCATYKLCLWLYCILYAIPKSGSNILVALATDKRNDFICTYTVIICTSIAYACKAGMSDQMYDKVDPLVSLAMSIFIMYSWAQLMVEHMQTLSVPVAPEDKCEQVRDAVMQCCEGSPCSVNPDTQIKVFFSSESCSAEIYLTVKDGETPYRDVAKTVAKLKTKLEALELERATICTSLASPVNQAF